MRDEGLIQADVPCLQSLCPVWNFDFEGVAIAVFDSHEDAHVAISTNSRRIALSDPIAPTLVRADAVSWKVGKTESANLEQHVFPLMNRRSAACTIEAFVERANGEIAKIAIVQPCFSPLLMSAGMTNRSSLLVFSDPKERIQSLRKLRDEMKTTNSIGYSPIEECVVGRVFAKMRPAMSSTIHYESAFDPQKIWTSLQSFLCELSTLTSDCIDIYNDYEIDATGTKNDFSNVALWRDHVL